MRILGVDCGSERTGFGVIDSDGRSHRLVCCGVITTRPRQALGLRLAALAERLEEVIGAQAPEAAAVEKVFYATNVKTALTLAHARGAVLLVLARAGIDCAEYSPLEVKTSVVGYGRAAKAQVQKMVASLLGLSAPVGSEDAADALAVAICHATHAHSPTIAAPAGKEVAG